MKNLIFINHIMYSITIKPILDFTFSLFGIIILSPLLLILILILIIDNKGKPFFYQKRAGKKGAIFKIIKFKTMNDNTDPNGEFLPQNKRITVIGEFIRKYSLDEIPQLVNVIKGNMSLIGPRPLLPEYLEHYTLQESKRHDILPGITGWAQVNGRTSIDWKQKFDYDIWYVSNISLKTDLKIILLTLKRLFDANSISKADNIEIPKFTGTKET